MIFAIFDEISAISLEKRRFLLCINFSYNLCSKNELDL